MTALVWDCATMVCNAFFGASVRIVLANAEVSRSAPLLAQVGSTDGLCTEA